MKDNDPQAGPLGARLDDVARRLAARHLTTYAWAGALVPVLERAAQLTDGFSGRFERDEIPAGPAEPTAAPVGRYPGQAPPTAAPATRPSANPPTAVADAVWAAQAVPAAQAEETGEPLPADLRARLREVAGPGAGALRVHHDSSADITARAHRADAVTVGRDVYLRDGRFRPDEPAGFALLAHEAAHVTALQAPGGASRRGAPGGIGAEEEAALAREQAALDSFGRRRTGDAPAAPTWFPAAPGPQHAAPAGPTRPAARPGTADQAQASPAAPAAAAHPMTAPEDRPQPQQAPFDLEKLRRDVISDLMRQLRTEFERGG